MFLKILKENKIEKLIKIKKINGEIKEKRQFIDATKNNIYGEINENYRRGINGFLSPVDIRAQLVDIE